MYPQLRSNTFFIGGSVEISRLEQCPKCKGYVMLQRDSYGWYVECLQCGYTHDLLTFAEAEQRRIEEKELDELRGLMKS
jgi:Zn ribbon nucleic-acid-binding protein